MRVRKLLAVLAVTTLTAGVGVVAMGGAPTGAAETKGYTIVWDTGSGCSLGTIDLATAAVNALPASSQTACVADLAVSPEGAVFGLLDLKDDGLDARLVTFDLSNGAPTSHVITGNFTTSSLRDGGLAFAPDGSLLAHFTTNESGCVPSSATCLYRVDPNTFAATLIGPSTQADDPFFYLAAACNGSTLSTEFTQQAPPRSTDDVTGALNGLSDQQLASWNTSTGAATRGAELPSNFDVGGLEYDRVAGTLYALGLELKSGSTTSPDSVNPQLFAGASLYTVDPATGAVTYVANVPDTELVVDSLAIPGTCAAPAAVELAPRFTG